MRTALFAILLAAVAVAGCGSTSATGNASHATAAPSVTPAQMATEAPVPASSPPSIPASSTPAGAAAPAPAGAPTRRPAPPVSAPPAPKPPPPPPPPVSKKPVPKPPPPPAPKPSCYPLSDEGTCYEPGEFCRDSDHGATGVAGDGEAIKCEDNDGWRWEPQ
jgi:outer membrane biosynthesis protein TonB